MIVLARIRSTLVLTTYINIGKTLAMCPWSMNRNGSKYSFALVWLMWLSLYISSVISSTVTIKLRYTEIRIMDLLEVASAFCLVVSLLATSPFSREHWRTLIRLTVQEDVTVKLWNFRLRGYLRVIVVHACMFSLTYGLLSAWLGKKCGCDNFNTCLLSISYAMKWYYQFLMVNLFWELSGTLEHRYRNLQKAIEYCFPLSASRTSNNKNVLESIRKIKSSYGDLHEAVGTMNRIFGVSLVFFLLYTTVSILNSCSWCLYYVHSAKTTPEVRLRKIISSVVSPLYNSVQTIFLVMACDRVERSGKEVITACHMMQRRIDRSGWGEELIYLAKFLKHLAPKFPAAGLFNVNRKMLSSLLSCTTSYIIVILQFRAEEK